MAGSIADRALLVVSTFTRPGPIDPDSIRQGLMALKPLVAEPEGAQAFLKGPPGLPHKGDTSSGSCSHVAGPLRSA